MTSLRIGNLFLSQKYSQGKLKEHALKQLTNYLANNIPYFEDYPMKAIESIASKID
jgi:hypothetical protein